MILKKDLARIVGCSRAHLSEILNGKQDASKALAEVLAKKTGTMPGLWIFGKKTDRLAAYERLNKKP
jgi:plasmid maintenance system antidote protein VapI